MLTGSASSKWNMSFTCVAFVLMYLQPLCLNNHKQLNGTHLTL